MAASNYDDIDRFGPGTAYQEPSSGVSGFVKILVATFAVLVAAAIGWVVWIAYDEGVRAGAVKTVPVIRADIGDIKRKPDEPGGLVVPHQDKLVFNRLAPGQANQPIERLLPLPEVPLAQPVKESRTPPEKSVGPASAMPAPALAPPLPKLVEAAPVKEPPAAVALAPPAALPEPEQLAAKTPPPPAELDVETPASAPTLDKSPEIAAGDAWRVQLVSLSNLKDAESVWGRMKKANTDLLGGLELQVQTVKLPKGTFYRVQAGPLANRAAADSLCGTLKSRKQDCLVVAPK